MSGASPLTVEHVIADSEPTRGYHEDFVIPLSSAVYGTGATDPAIVSASDLVTIQWQASDNGALYLPLALPGQWAGAIKDTTTVKRGEFALVMLAGLVGTASQNTLALDASLVYIEKGAVQSAAVDPYKVTVNGVEESSPAGGAVIGDQRTSSDAPLELIYLFDLKDVDPKSGITVKLVPSAAISTGNALKIYSIAGRMRRHAAIANRAERDPIW